MTHPLRFCPISTARRGGRSRPTGGRRVPGDASGVLGRNVLPLGGCGPALSIHHPSHRRPRQRSCSEPPTGNTTRLTRVLSPHRRVWPLRRAGATNCWSESSRRVLSLGRGVPLRGSELHQLLGRSTAVEGDLRDRLGGATPQCRSGGEIRRERAPDDVRHLLEALHRRTLASRKRDGVIYLVIGLVSSAVLLGCLAGPALDRLRRPALHPGITIACWVAALAGTLHRRYRERRGPRRVVRAPLRSSSQPP